MATSRGYDAFDALFKDTSGYITLQAICYHLLIGVITNVCVSNSSDSR